MNNKLQAKDLINLGLFTVLYFVIGCCVAILIGFLPVFLPIPGALWTLITGIPFMVFLTVMDGVSLLTETEKKRGILLDPRTKLILMLTITTLMFSTSNNGVMNIIKPLLSLVSFGLILSGRQFKTAGKYLILYTVCFVLERVALIWMNGLLSFINISDELSAAALTRGLGAPIKRTNVCRRGSEQPIYDTARVVGSVFQNPRSQFFNVETTGEITFGCENPGQPEHSIKERLAKTIHDFRLEKLMGRNIFHLSGGEKQKIACAGVSIMEPDVLVLDEPSSNLDAASILDLQNTLAFWKARGKTIIVSEHRLYYLRGLTDRFIYIKEGKIKQNYSAEEFEKLSERNNMGLRTFILETLQPPEPSVSNEAGVELRNFHFAYKNEPETLHIQDCKIPAERIVGIIGNNGAGKSTFVRCCCGLEKRCGKIVWNGKIYSPKDRLNTCYMVMQEVNHQLFTETVLDEVLISMEVKNQKLAEEILAKLDLQDYQNRHPISLSGGQKQRVAIASAIASKRSILFFDEPTSGLDYRHMKEVANVLQQMKGMGITVYVITHDLELILECCTDIIHFEAGAIANQYPMDEEGLKKIKDYYGKTE